MTKQEIKVLKPIIYTYDDTLPLPPLDGKYRKMDVKLFKYLTFRIRSTFEYKYLIQFMKKSLDLNHCAYYKTYTMETISSVELHHAPFTLFDYVETVCTKHYKDDGYIIPYKIEEEVNKLHYEFKVGLIPLSPTVHKIVHSGNLDIHPSMIVGKFEVFYNDYKEYLSDEVIGKMDHLQEQAKIPLDKMDFPEVLKYKPVLIDNTKFKKLEKFDISKMIIDNIKKTHNLLN